MNCQSLFEIRGDPVFLLRFSVLFLHCHSLSFFGSTRKLKKKSEP